MVKILCLALTLTFTLTACSEKKATIGSKYYKEDNYRFDDNFADYLLNGTGYLYPADELKIYKDTFGTLFGIKGCKLVYQTYDKDVIKEILFSAREKGGFQMMDRCEKIGYEYRIFIFDDKARKYGYFILKPCKSGEQIYGGIVPSSDGFINYSETIIPLMQRLKVL